MDRISIVDAADPRLVDYVGLRDAQLRTAHETATGVFVAEGEKIIRRAAAAGCRPRSFLLQEKWLSGLGDILEHTGVPCYVASGALIERVSGFHVHRGALAVFERPRPRTWDEVLTGRRVIVCDEVVDHANLGAIARIAAGLGWDAMVVSRGCADPLYRRAIKASMGATLQLPWKRMDDDADLARVKAAGYVLAATSLSSRSVDLAGGFRPPDGKLALLLGTEGHGLRQEWEDTADVHLTVPMAAGVDSLNVAAAAAIFAYQLR